MANISIICSINEHAVILIVMNVLSHSYDELVNDEFICVAKRVTVGCNVGKYLINGTIIAC